MFCTNVVLCNTGFNSKSSLARNMALITSIHQALKNWVYFLHLLDTQSKKIKIKNPVTKQAQFFGGLHYQPIKDVKQSLLEGV